MSAFNVNEQRILGNATNDPELKYTPNGTPVVSFSVATNHSVKDESEESGYRSVPTFHNVVYFGKLAEGLLKNGFAKGMKVYAEGRTSHRSWEHEGKKYYRTEIIANKVIMMSAGKPKEEIADTYDDSEDPY